MKQFFSRKCTPVHQKLISYSLFGYVYQENAAIG